MTEVLVADNTALAAAVTSPPLVAQSSQQRLQLTGFAKVLTQVGYGSGGARSGQPNPFALPYDRLIDRHQLLLRLQYARGSHFEAVASGLLDFSVFESDPRTQAIVFNGFNGSQARTPFVAEAREVYVGLFFGPLDVRLGEQRIAWGKGDIFSRPTR